MQHPHAQIRFGLSDCSLKTYRVDQASSQKLAQLVGHWGRHRLGVSVLMSASGLYGESGQVACYPFTIPVMYGYAVHVKRFIVEGLKRADIDWLSATLRVERALVRQRVGDVKTVYSGRLMSIDSGMLELLKSWRQNTQFSGDND